MLSKKQFKEILISAEIISEADFDKYNKESESVRKEIISFLVEKEIITNTTLYQAVANFYKVPFINLKNQTIRKDVLLTIPETISTAHRIIAFDSDTKKIKLAVNDPEDLEIFSFIRKKTGLEIEIHLTTPENIKEALKQYHKSLKAEFNYLQGDVDKASDSANDQKDLKKLAEDLPVVRIVDTLLEYAVMESASDIHIEPEEKDVIVRYRIDGILHNMMVLPKNVQSGIVARIKILSNLKVDEHRLPQDGRFKIQNKDYKVAFRVSILPTFDGEKMVLRLLNEKAQVLGLDQLGFQKSALEALQRSIDKPNGIILVTGPTGSGKTTTLYTVLNILNKPEVNISTIEDPIEYRMERVNQSQVNSKIGYTFASGLRAFLRQDPDIIMVGEIRDQETAEIAVHAAMTGHLVLSTIHTNSAAATMPRLSEMGVPSFLIATTANVIMGQRLVRKICSNCIQSYNLDEKSIKNLEDQLDVDTLLKSLVREKAIMTTKGGLKSLLFYRGKGCKKCNNTGYKGRIGIYEVLENLDNIRELILHGENTKEIHRQAVKNGMVTMMEDGFIKAKSGITTIEEVLRVSKE